MHVPHRDSAGKYSDNITCDDDHLLGSIALQIGNNDIRRICSAYQSPQCALENAFTGFE